MKGITALVIIIAIIVDVLNKGKYPHFVTNALLLGIYYWVMEIGSKYEKK